MGSEWKTKALKDCATWYSGGTPRKGNPDFWNGSIPWISAKSLKEFFISDSEDKVSEDGLKNGTRLVPKNSILFIVRGMSLKSEFRMGITTRAVSFNQDLKALVAKDGMLPMFLAYAIKGKTAEILDLVGEAGHGTGVLPTDRIQAIQIPDLPLNEQQKIVDILKTLDDKIELNRRMNATLEAMAQALFKSWFIDFDPVIDNILVKNMSRNQPSPNLSQGERNADAQHSSSPLGRSGDEGAFQDAIFEGIPEELSERAKVRRQAWENVAPAALNKKADGAGAPSLPEYNESFPAAFQQTESMGWIPEGWEIQKFGKLAQNIREGVDPSTLPDETPYVGLEHIDRQSFSLSRWGVATDADSQKSHFKPKDFLFGKLRPYFHKVCHVTSEGICSTDILVIRPHKENDAGYVGCQIFEPEFVEYANLRSTGTRMPRASWKDMAKYEVACPPESLRTTFNCQIEPIRKKCAGAVAANQTLTKLRDTLLPKLISGELRLPEAKQLTEEALA